MKKYLLAISVIVAAVGFEYWSLVYRPSASLLLKLQANGIISSTAIISTELGRPVSLWLGYIGFGLMVIMNVYSIRKRMKFMSGWGRLPEWLDFHIFCGILGPALILFHCNLKVRGIVGISFWSMMISFSSGVIGRYFYVQLLRKRNDYEQIAEGFALKLGEFLKKQNLNIENELVQLTLSRAVDFVGGIGAKSVAKDTVIGPVAAFARSIVGDIKLMYGHVPVPKNWPAPAIYLTQEYALNKRRAEFLGPFQKLMGYWHAFHFPFAVFMYVAAIIHIISSLIFLKS